jgi:hypothetical protein
MLRNPDDTIPAPPPDGCEDMDDRLFEGEQPLDWSEEMRKSEEIRRDTFPEIMPPMMT